MLLKILAWNDRRQERDLVDVARLALLDWNRGTIAAELASLSLPAGLRAKARQLVDALAHPDGPGATAFVRTFRAQLLDPFEPGDDEDAVRQIVTSATRRLLRGMWSD